MDREQEQRPTTSKDIWTSSLTDLNDKRHQKRMKIQTEETREAPRDKVYSHPLYPRNSNSYTKVTVRQGKGFREFRIHHLSKRKTLVIPEEFIHGEDLNVFVDPPYLALYIGEQEFYPLDEGRLAIPENEMKYRMTSRGPVQEFTLRPYSNPTSKDEIYCQGPHCLPAHHVPIVDLEKDVSPTQGISVKGYKSPITFLNSSRYKPNRLRFKDDGTRRVYLSDTDLEKNSDLFLSDNEYDGEVYASRSPKYKERIQRPQEWHTNGADFDPAYEFQTWPKDQEPLNYSRSDQDYRVHTPRSQHSGPPERYQDGEFPKVSRYPEYKRSYSTSPRRNVPESQTFEERALSPSQRRKSIHPIQFVREHTISSPKETASPHLFAMGRSPRTQSPTVRQKESSRQFVDERLPPAREETTSPHLFAMGRSPRTQSPTVRQMESSPRQFVDERLPPAREETTPPQFRGRTQSVRPNEAMPPDNIRERTLPLSPQETTSPYLFERRTHSPSVRPNESMPHQFSLERTLPLSAHEEITTPHAFSQRRTQSPTFRPKESTSPNRLILERTPSPVAQNDLATQYVQKRALSPILKQTGSYPYNDETPLTTPVGEDYSAPPSRELPSNNSNDTLNSTRLDSPTYGMVKVTHSSTEVHPSRTPERNATPEKRKSMDKVLLRIKEEMDPLKKQMVELHQMLKKEEKPKKKVKIRQEPLSVAPSQRYPKTNARFPSAAELVEEFSKLYVAGTKDTRGKIVNSERNLKDFNQSLSRAPSSSRYHKSCIQSPEAVKLKKDKT